MRLLPIVLVACGSSAPPSPATATIDPTFAELATHLDARASAWVGKRDWKFVTGGQCAMSCHTTVPFLLVRDRLPGTSPAAAQLRTFVEQRVSGWANAKPLYDWIPDKSRGTESVVNAFALAALHSPQSSAAFDAMWAQQRADGSFAWWDEFKLAPWEDEASPTWGAALAELAVTLAPDYLAHLPAEHRDHLARLEQLLATRAADPHVSLHHRATIVHVARPGVVDVSTREAILAEIHAAQHADGSWDAAALGIGATTTEPHAYATAFFTFVTGDARGKAWLRAHVHAGTLAAPSISKPGDAQHDLYMSDAATAYAALALAP